MEPESYHDLALLEEPARQSPVAIVQLIVQNFRRIGAVNLVVGLGLLLSNRLPSWLLPLVPIAGLILVASGVASWWRLTFRATSKELIVTSGVFSRDTMTIPFSKVQSVSIEEGLVQRLFGLVSASVDTAGALAVEFSIHGIKRSQAEAIRRLASQAKPRGEATTRPLTPPMGAGQGLTEGLGALPPPVGPPVSVPVGPPVPTVPVPTTVLVERTPKELMEIGMLGNPLGGLAILGAFFLFADDAVKQLGVGLPDLDGSSVDPSLTLALTAVATAILVFILSWFAIGLRTVVTDWDLRLTTDQEGISITAGLLKRRSQASHLNKVQSVEATHGPLLRMAGFCRVRLHTIGSGDFLLPGVTRPELASIRDAVALPFFAEPVRGISRHLVFQRIRLACYLAVPAAIGTAFLDLRFAVAWLVFPVAVGVKAHLFHRSFRWDIADRTISRRSGNLFIAEMGMSLDKTQAVRVNQSYYQRKRGLSTFAVSNAESALTIPMLPLEESQALRDLLLA